MNNETGLNKKTIDSKQGEYLAGIDKCSKRFEQLLNALLKTENHNHIIGAVFRLSGYAMASVIKGQKRENWERCQKDLFNILKNRIKIELENFEQVGKQ